MASQIRARTELVVSLGALFASGSYSDLVIVSSRKKYNVHKAIICPRSIFFSAACRGNFKESLTGIIDLSEDDPQAVDLMLRYFYHLDYVLPPPEEEDLPNTSGNRPAAKGSLDPNTVVYEIRNGNMRAASAVRNTTESKTPLHHLTVHAKVFALAEKYAITGLYSMAKIKFQGEACIFWDTADFLDAAEYIFSSTPSHVRDLREIFVESITTHSMLLTRNARLNDMITNTEGLGSFLALYMLERKN